MGRTINVGIAPVFLPLYQPKRYKGAKGGRGSAKSHDRAGALVRELAARQIRAVCIREVQKSISESAKQLIQDKITEYEMLDQFEVQTTKIICKTTGSVCLFQGMQDHTADTIKSLEGIDIAWVEEANKLSHRSMKLLRPTIRKEGSEIWFTWNPEDDEDPVDQFFSVLDDDMVVVHSNYMDNPWLPETLRKEAERDRRNNPLEYPHIWLGEHADITEGSYYATLILNAREDNRLCRVPYEASSVVHTAWDLGIGDATSIWFFQLIGKEVRIIDFYESSGVGLDHYVGMLNSKPYSYGETLLPHDAKAKELGTGKSREEVLWSLGVYPRILPAASVEDGINAVRALLPRCWFDAEKCKDGIRALRRYHREFDDKRNTFKPRPVHDWASHAADAFRYLAAGIDTISHTKTEPLKIPDYGTAV